MKKFLAAILLIASLAVLAATPVASAPAPSSQATITFSLDSGPNGCSLTITSTKGISYVEVNGNKTEYSGPEVHTETIAVTNGDVITVKSGTTVETYTVTACGGLPPTQCDEATQSGGEGVTRTVHELGQSSGTFNFTYQAYGVPDQFDVYYQGQLIFSTGVVSGGATVPITYSGTATTVEVVVTGPSGTLWDYTVSCPV